MACTQILAWCTGENPDKDCSADLQMDLTRVQCSPPREGGGGAMHVPSLNFKTCHFAY